MLLVARWRATRVIAILVLLVTFALTITPAGARMTADGPTEERVLNLVNPRRSADSLQAAWPTDRPTRPAMFYHPPKNGVSPSTLAVQSNLLILHRGRGRVDKPGDERYRDLARNNGFSGAALLYLLANETSGPPYRIEDGVRIPSPPLRSGDVCDDRAWAYKKDETGFTHYPDLTGIDGEFCQRFHGDELSFLHNKDTGERLYDVEEWEENNEIRGVYIYLMNPASTSWRSFVATRATQELTDPSRNAFPDYPPGNQHAYFDGLFLDNLDHSLQRGEELAANGGGQGSVQKYQGDHAAYRSAVQGFLAYLRDPTRLPTTPIWANLTELTATDRTRADGWDYYLGYLTGVMEEGFGADFASGTSWPYVSPEVWEAQYQRAKRAISEQGKAYLSVAQGVQGDTNRMLFALASHLLVANERAFFRYADGRADKKTDDNYTSFWYYGADTQYPARLGVPTEARQSLGNGRYKRAFTNGVVTVDLTQHTGTITLGPPPTPTPNPCVPRPDVKVAVSKRAINELAVTVQDGRRPYTELRFSPVTVGAAQIDIGGQTLVPPFTYAVPPGADRVDFVVRRTSDDKIVTVPFVVHDGCGDWPTFVGGGETAWDGPSAPRPGPGAPVASPSPSVPTPAIPTPVNPPPSPSPGAACRQLAPGRVTTLRDGPGRLRATVTAAAPPGATNRLRELRFGDTVNARILIDGRPVGDNRTVVLPSGLTQTSFLVERIDPTRSTSVRLYVIDDCGAWLATVGGAPHAF